MKSGSLNLLEPSWSVQVRHWIGLPLPINGNYIEVFLNQSFEEYQSSAEKNFKIYARNNLINK